MAEWLTGLHMGWWTFISRVASTSTSTEGLSFMMLTGDIAIISLEKLPSTYIYIYMLVIYRVSYLTTLKDLYVSFYSWTGTVEGHWKATNAESGLKWAASLGLPFDKGRAATFGSWVQKKGKAEKKDTGLRQHSMRFVEFKDVKNDQKTVYTA